jgi:hypothetical protein
MRRRQALLATAFVAVLVPATATGKPPSLEQTTIPIAGVALEIPRGWIRSPLVPKIEAQHVVAVWGAPRLTRGFRTTLSVIKTSVTAGETLDEWLLGSQGSKYAKLGALRHVRVNGVSALAYTSSKLDSFQGKPLLVVEYAFFHARAGYLFTYTSPVIAQAPLFDASAQTIAFATSPPPS